MIRKNKKFIDPRYFMEEKMEKTPMLQESYDLPDARYIGGHAQSYQMTLPKLEGSENEYVLSDIQKVMHKIFTQYQKNGAFEKAGATYIGPDGKQMLGPGGDGYPTFIVLTAKQVDHGTLDGVLEQAEREIKNALTQAKFVHDHVFNTRGATRAAAQQWVEKVSKSNDVYLGPVKEEELTPETGANLPNRGHR